MIYYIYDELGLIRITKSRTEAKYLVSLRPDWRIVVKKEVKPVIHFEDALM
jgi:hypothetical protein